MGREVFDTRFLASKLDQCRVITMMAKVRRFSFLLSGVLAVSAVASLIGREFVLTVLLLACLTSLMILRSLIHRAWGGSAKLAGCLGTVRRELDYLARFIDSGIEEHEEKISVKRGNRGRVIRNHETAQVSLLKAIRYALVLKANRMRDFLSSDSEDALASCFAFTLRDLAVFSGVTERPSLQIKMEDVPHEIRMLLRGVGRNISEENQADAAEAA